ncbi:UNVERIFIED_CONTAM: hypothetical protein Sradi_6594900 [Sesamum radiatum]|uniref:Uncharacterized protein n=1 Tax=Sesamum radiatum TaxID=300843 RepID=A0AAW2K0J5_SESRA
MGSTDDGEYTGGGEGSIVGKVKSRSPLRISTSQRGLIGDENAENGGSSALSKRLRFLKFGNLASPSAKFQRIAEERDEVSRNVPSSSSLHIRERFQRIFSKKIDWNSLGRLCKEWIRDPMNLALFIWITCVAVSGAILFMVMTGMLNHALPKKSQRDAWFEVNNQILNALFTLMCLYQHPKRIYHLSLLLRWRPDDVLKLRKIYCKNGTYKPNEWAHMMVVVALLNLNCFAQYALCGLNLGYKRSEASYRCWHMCISGNWRPAFAGIYSMLSPLGKDYETEIDEEAQIPVTTEDSSRSDQSRRISLEKRFSFALRDDERTVETRPQWSGGVLDFWDDISLAYLSLFCSFCFWMEYGETWVWEYEVRTGNSYDIVEDKFYKKKGDQLPMSPLPREDGEFQLRSSPSSLGNSPSPPHIMKANSPSPSRFSKEYNSPGRQLPVIEEESRTHSKDATMTPPGPSVIRREEI